MNIKNVSVIATRNDNHQMIDISTLIISLTWETAILEQPGKLDIEQVDDGKTYLPEGSKITVTIDDTGLFVGYIFERSRSARGNISITAFDQMRYLQNKDTINMPILTASEVFEKIGREQHLNAKVVHASTHKVPAKVYDNKSYYEMIQESIDITLADNGLWYMLRDNFGVLEFVDITKLLTNLIIGDNSLLTDYSFSSSINNETYNKIKLAKENKKSGKREIYEFKDTDNINKWGLLQQFESVTDELNEAQIKKRGEQLLLLKNKPTRELTLNCLGDKRIRAGNGVLLAIEDLKNENIPYYLNVLVMTCKHTFRNDIHTMEIAAGVI